MSDLKEPEDILMELLTAEDGNVSPNHNPHEQDLHINQALAALTAYYEDKFGQQLKEGS